MGLEHLSAPLREGHVTSADGTEITYYVIGDGPRLWLMPPAMGAPLVSMRYLLERFASQYTIVSWDHRGFYRSGPPPNQAAMRVEDHLLDMEAVVAAERLDHFILGGWSMAVQLSLEYYHRRPDHVRALVLINGPFERALSAVARHPLAERFVIGLLRRAVSVRALLNPLSRLILGARGMGRVLERVGVIAQNAAFIEEILADFSTVDWGRYFTMTRLLHEHSAAEYLPGIRVPTLITSGTHDVVTPPATAERMHGMIAGSELFVVPHATHYIVAEFPDLLIERIAVFLAKVEALDAGP